MSTSPKTTASSGQEEKIPLSDLHPEQIKTVKEQVEEELQFYQQAILQLKQVLIRMRESASAIKALTPDKTEILVPVTGSMYIRGEIMDVGRVLVDIGTGYYVEKSVEDALDYFKRKVAFLIVQIDKIQALGREKTQIHAGVVQVLEAKLKQQPASPQKQMKIASKPK